MRARRRLATLSVAVGGVLAGHWLTYAIVSPAEAPRTTLLHDTGHAYLGAVSQVALVCSLAAVASMFLGALTGADRPEIAHLARRVVTFQVSAFIVLEVVERIVAGAPLASLLRSAILPVGVGTQAAVGAIAAAAIRWLLRAADRVAAVLARRAASASRAGAAWRPRVDAFLAPQRHLSATGVRGPPSSR